MVDLVTALVAVSGLVLLLRSRVPEPLLVLVPGVRASLWPGRDQKLQQITLSTSLTMIELPVIAGCAHNADCAI